MNLSDENLINNINKNKTIANYDLPFIKMTISGKKGETTHIIRKLNKSKNYIKNNVHQLLYSGFNGSLEDLYKVYGKMDTNRKRNPKPKIKLNNSFLVKSDLLYKPIQKTITKEFNFMNKKKIINMKSLLHLLRKKEPFKYNLLKNKDNKKKNNSSAKNLKIYKGNSSQPNFNEKNIFDKDKSIFNNMKKINKIRKLLNKKSRNILKNDTNLDFQKSTFETMEEKKDNEGKNKKYYSNRIEIIRSFIEKSEKKKKKNNTVDYINETYKKYLNKIEDDKTQFKKILDPLNKGYKAHL